MGEAMPAGSDVLPSVVGATASGGPIVDQWLQALRDRTEYGRVAGVFAVPAPSGGNDKDAIQAVIDQAIAAGGGIVELAAGTYRVDPLGTGIGLLTDGDLVWLRGQGPATEIVFTASTSTTPFVGIAPYRYNTCTAPYTAAPLLLSNLRLTADDYTTINCHNLFAFAHCPWGRVWEVGCEQGRFHAFEINCSKNIDVDIYIYGTGNFAAAIWELDGLGSCGQIATGGTHSVSTPIENFRIQVDQRVPRTDLTINTNGYDFGYLSHSNSSNVIRNGVIERCRIIPHNNSTLVAGNTSIVMGFDSAALPLTFENVVIRDNLWDASGGLTGSHVLLDLSAASSSTRNIRNVRVHNNTFLSPHGYGVRTGALNSATAPRTSITDAILRSHDNIVVEHNVFAVYLNGNANAARSVRSGWFGAARSTAVRNNTLLWPDVANGSGWGTSTISSAFGFYCDHIQNLDFADNTVEITRPQTGGTAGLWCQVYAFNFACGAFEIQSALTGVWNIEGNKAIGNGNIGVNLACGFLTLYGAGTEMTNWTSKTAPRISGNWRGNSSIQTGTGTYTHTLQATYPDYFVTAAALGNTTQTEAQMATMGGHDWYPGSPDVGTVTTVPAGATMGPGWKLYDGSASTALPWLQESAWNYRLGLSGTANLPTTANTFVRLSGQ